MRQNGRHRPPCRSDWIVAEAGGTLETIDGDAIIYNLPDADHDSLIAGSAPLARAAAAAIGPY